MTEAHEPDTFAALEKREWTTPGVVRSYAQVFAKAADIVVPYLVEAVSAKIGVRALDLGEYRKVWDSCVSGLTVAGVWDASRHRNLSVENSSSWA